MLRPAQLDPLFASVASLKGVGQQTRKTLGRLLGDTAGAEPRVIDLLLHAPTSAVDRRHHTTVADAAVGTICTVTVRIEEHRGPPLGRSNAPYRVLTSDDTADLLLVYFAGDKSHLKSILPIGAQRVISGRIELYDGIKQIVHPDHVLDPSRAGALPTVEPVYPLTEGLHGKALARAMQDALRRVPTLPEWIDPEQRARSAWPAFGDALRALHAPETPDDVAIDGAAFRRLAYDELFADQLAISLLRARVLQAHGRSTTGDGHLVAAVRAALPYTLTRAQEDAVADIIEDLGKPQRMLRLLQGDVGAGKTAVALLAMARVAEAGRQSALMAPTEILARQHYKTIEPLARAAGLRVALLTGREKGRERGALLADLATGRIAILVGTHALFQDDVTFADLALAVVDEQHRFGVHQRLALAGKGEAVDLLVTTATPIPRTLVMTYYGDMDVSRLTEKPAGRQPITTRAVPLDRLDEVVQAVGRAMATGARVYWVCPLVSESEKVDQAAAEARYADLVHVFGPRAGLLHGRMKAADKESAISAFARGEIRVLVATTVVEVGIDVSEATVIVIEQAERFGLAQLHQLRGRVGRGEEKSTCLLLYDARKLSEVARERLTVIRDTEDGFAIAEADLRLRGPGEILGTKQSGLPETKIVRWEAHGDLVAVARDDARLLLQRDRELTSPRGRAARLLLHLFGKAEAVKLVEAG